jgi:hypothetical protein
LSRGSTIAVTDELAWPDLTTASNLEARSPRPHRLANIRFWRDDARAVVPMSRCPKLYLSGSGRQAVGVPWVRATRRADHLHTRGSVRIWPPSALGGNAAVGVALPTRGPATSPDDSRAADNHGGAVVKSSCAPADGQRDMRYFRVRAGTWLATTLLVASAAGLAGCIKIGEGGLTFVVVNHTSQTLTIVPRIVVPGEPAPLDAAADPQLRLRPGARDGERDSLAPGGCLYETFSAYSSTGELIATDPSPICEDTHGHGGTWTITAK